MGELRERFIATLWSVENSASFFIIISFEVDMSVIYHVRRSFKMGSVENKDRDCFM